MNAIVQVALADFRQRVRSPAFLAVVALAVLLGYSVLSGVFVLRVDGFRGVYNAAWIGLLMATTGGFFLSLFGFYLVRGSVRRDRVTGVGEVLAATPLRSVAYVAGTFASSVAVLLAVVATLAAAAVVMLFVHGEDRAPDLFHLLMPFALLTAPVALAAAAMAVLFDCVPRLREGAGNVVYFVTWLAAVIAFGSDLLGFDAIVAAATRTLDAAGLAYSGGVVLGIGGGDLRTFTWTGFDWWALVPSRLVYLATALGLAALALLPFDRFDPSHSRPPRRARRTDARSASDDAPDVAPLPTETGSQPRPSAASLVVPTRGSAVGALMGLVAAETILLLKGRPLAWYALSTALVVACALSPVDVVQRWLLPLAWAPALLIWSELGAREATHQTHELLASTPSPVVRPLAAAWIAGVALALLTGSGALVHAPASPTLLVGFVAGALFVPALALALGTASGSPRPFQVIALVLWYLGPLNGVPAFDLTGATDVAAAQGVPWAYLAASPVLLVAAALMRRHAIRPLSWRRPRSPRRDVGSPV